MLDWPVRGQVSVAVTVRQKLKPRCILLVESELLLLNLLCTILEQAGFTVLPSPTAEGAIHLAERLSGNIDLLLTSVALPRISGPELAGELEQAIPGLRVMIISSDATAGALALSSGWHFTQKPFTPSALLDGIQRVLDLDLTPWLEAGRSVATL